MKSPHSLIRLDGYPASLGQYLKQLKGYPLMLEAMSDIAQENPMLL